MSEEETEGGGEEGDPIPVVVFMVEAVVAMVVVAAFVGCEVEWVGDVVVSVTWAAMVELKFDAEVGVVGESAANREVRVVVELVGVVSCVEIVDVEVEAAVVEWDGRVVVAPPVVVGC